MRRLGLDAGLGHTGGGAGGGALVDVADLAGGRRATGRTRRETPSGSNSFDTIPGSYCGGTGPPPGPPTPVSSIVPFISMCVRRNLDRARRPRLAAAGRILDPLVRGGLDEHVAGAAAGRGARVGADHERNCCPGPISRICFSMLCCDFAAATSSSMCGPLSRGQVPALRVRGVPDCLYLVRRAPSLFLAWSAQPFPGDCSVPTRETRCVLAACALPNPCRSSACGPRSSRAPKPLAPTGSSWPWRLDRLCVDGRRNYSVPGVLPPDS